MVRSKNILFILAAMIIGCSSIAYNLAGAIMPDVVDIPTYSDYEARYYAAAPALDAETVLTGDFQEDFTSFWSDRVPARNLAAFGNAALQRTSIALSACLLGYETYPTFFGSRYYVTPKNGLIVDRAEKIPAHGGGQALDAWTRTLNDAARNYPDKRFVYDCVARHDQTEANPTYKYYGNRINPAWIQSNILDRLDPSIATVLDVAESYDEVKSDWIATEEHWKLTRALKSYEAIAEILGWKRYNRNETVEVVDKWYGDYARNGLDLDIPTNLEDVPTDFSYLTFYELGGVGGPEKSMGLREDVLAGRATVESGGVSKYYGYYGGGTTEAVNAADSSGKTALIICDSLSYCLERYIASNYSHSVFLLPGNDRFDQSFESYIEQYDPDDVIVIMHATKYEMVASYSPRFIGVENPIEIESDGKD